MRIDGQTVGERASRMAKARSLQWEMVFNGMATMSFDQLMGLSLHTGLEMLFALQTHGRLQKEAEKRAREEVEREVQGGRGGHANFNERYAEAIQQAQRG